MDMKVDAIGLLTNAAMLLKRKNADRSFALLELANNLRLLMRGEVSLEKWNNHYVGADREPIDTDALLP